MSLPITVIIPTLNARNELPGHLDALEQWIWEASQIIVVDSGSQDGSLDYLKMRFGRTHKAEFYVRPPGLYAAWNFAVGCAGSEFVYFATVGDCVVRDGLSSLLACAEKMKADVVLSPPIVVNGAGEPIPDARWPIHQLLSEREAAEPFLLTPFEKVALANAFGIQGLLGSSASNLYRTRVLRDHPFPTDAGHAGDTAWGCRNALRVSVAVLPRAVATFVESKPDGRLSDVECSQRELSFARLAREGVEELAGSETMDAAELAALRLLTYGWVRSRNWVAGQIEAFAPLMAGHRQQQAYIGDLEMECAKRLEAINHLDAEIRRLRAEQASGRRKFWMLRRR